MSGRPVCLGLRSVTIPCATVWNGTDSPPTDRLEACPTDFGNVFVYALTVIRVQEAAI